mgnify:FL=1
MMKLTKMKRFMINPIFLTTIGLTIATFGFTIGYAMFIIGAINWVREY